MSIAQATPVAVQAASGHEPCAASNEAAILAALQSDHVVQADAPVLAPRTLQESSAGGARNPWGKLLRWCDPVDRYKALLLHGQARQLHIVEFEVLLPMRPGCAQLCHRPHQGATRAGRLQAPLCLLPQSSGSLLSPFSVDQ